MKTVHKIDPEKEYAAAKALIELAGQQMLDQQSAASLDQSVDNLITAARILMEREQLRRGKPKDPPTENAPKGRQKGDLRTPSGKLPSQRYLNLEIIETEVKPQVIPTCSCCGIQMKESGLFDTSEKLEVKPKTYFISRLKRVKYNCKCSGSMTNTPPVHSIVPSSNYGDSLIIDCAMSKYCDLIPIERYVQMAFRDGLEDLPAQSLIGVTHHLANFLNPVYELIKKEVQSAEVLMADETTWRMLEGDESSQWYLWGFFSKVACYFEAHDTRSGDVATKFLDGSSAKYLMSDGYGGYRKALNALRDQGRVITETYCNSHAYRYFKEASQIWKDECQPFLERYGQIYDLERYCARDQLLAIFVEIKTGCEQLQHSVMPGSALLKAINYFLNHFEGLTQCCANKEIPLDNNLAERQIRPPVVGKKTWYGTHSKRGALTTAVLFSIVQSCKLNNINPRKYIAWVVEQIHQGKAAKTPSQYLAG